MFLKRGCPNPVLHRDDRLVGHVILDIQTLPLKGNILRLAIQLGWWIASKLAGSIIILASFTFNCSAGTCGRKAYIQAAPLCSSTRGFIHGALLLPLVCPSKGFDSWRPIAQICPGLHWAAGIPSKTLDPLRMWTGNRMVFPLKDPHAHIQPIG